MNKIVKSKKGASSILVILMLVVLVVFGVAALTTALSNVRLGLKAADWNDKYYAADAKANEVYAAIDKAAAEWQTSAGTGSSDEELKHIISSLDLGVSVEQASGVTVNFMYEVWQEDVGISVVLTYDTNSGSFDITRYQAETKKLG